MSPAIVLDLGTAHVGVVVAPPVLPLLILDAWTPEVNKHDPDTFARNVAGMVAHYWTGPLPPDVVCEFGALYIPAGANEQKARAMADAHAAMARMLDRVWQALPGPFYRVATIARRSWSCRVAPGVKGGVSNEEASAGLAAWLDPAGAWPKLSDQHRRDAAGALVGHLIRLGEPEAKATVEARAPGKRIRKRYPRKPKPRPPHVLARLAAEAAQDAAADRLLEAAQARLAAHSAPLPSYSRPCGCGARGPHRTGCEAASSPGPR